MRLFVVVALILGMASPVMAGGNALDSMMNTWQWMDQMETNREMRETMRQQQELQQRQIEEMDKRKVQTYEASPQQVEAVNRELDKARKFINERPEYRDSPIMLTCLTSIVQDIIADPGYKHTDMTTVMFIADMKLKEMIIAEAAKLNAKK